MLKVAVLSMLAIIVASSTLTVVHTEGHGVCAMTSCDTSPCPSVIKPCLAPAFPDVIRNQFDVIVVVSVIAGLLSVAFLAFRSYLKRKDFYIVR